MKPPSSKPHATGLDVWNVAVKIEPGVDIVFGGGENVVAATVLSIVMPALRAAVVPFASVPTYVPPPLTNACSAVAPAPAGIDWFGFSSAV